MLRIPFINAKFVDESCSGIEERLLNFLSMLRHRAVYHGKKIKRFSLLDDDETLPEMPVVTSSDRRKVHRRAERLHEAQQIASGLSHLKKDDLKALQPLRLGVDLVTVTSEDWADEVAAMLHAEFPWMGPATTEVWLALRRAAVEGEVAISLPNLLLVGPPGIGKSAWARRLAEILCLPSCVIEIASGATNFRIVGLERGWSSGMPGRPLETIIAHRVANPIVIVDEICKDQSMRNSRGNVSSASDGLLSLMEPMTATNWECPYYRVRFDMAHVNWILTANDLDKVSEPLRSRSTVVFLDEISKPDLQVFARRIGATKGLSNASIEAITDVIGHRGFSSRQFGLREVLRMVARAEAMETRPLLQ